MFNLKVLFLRKTDQNEQFTNILPALSNPINLDINKTHIEDKIHEIETLNDKVDKTSSSEIVDNVILNENENETATATATAIKEIKLNKEEENDKLEEIKLEDTNIGNCEIDEILKFDEKSIENSPKQIKIKNDQEIFCICHQPSYGEMICCDSEDVKI